jgi:hypothetical protein
MHLQASHISAGKRDDKDVGAAHSPLATLEILSFENMLQNS